MLKNTRIPGVYTVIKRTSKRVEGKKNPVPVEVGIVGKIINCIYVPLPPKDPYAVDFKTYGDVALYNLVCNSILKDLFKYWKFSLFWCIIYFGIIFHHNYIIPKKRLLCYFFSF